MPDLIWTQYGLAEDNGAGGVSLHNDSRQVREGRGHEKQRVASETQQARAAKTREASESAQRQTEEIAERVHERLARHVRHNRLEVGDTHDRQSTRGESELRQGMRTPMPFRHDRSERSMGATEFGLIAEQLRAMFKRPRRADNTKRQVTADRMRVEDVVAIPKKRGER